jgi:hypothetical protein
VNFVKSQNPCSAAGFLCGTASWTQSFITW